MTEVLITGGIGLISTIVSGWTSWIFARKKYNSEVDSNLIANMEKSLEFYEKLSDDTKLRLDKSLKENAELRKAIEGLLKENKQLKRELDTLKDQVIKITTTICTDLSCLIRNRDYSTLNTEKNEKSKS